MDLDWHHGDEDSELMALSAGSSTFNPMTQVTSPLYFFSALSSQLLVVIIMWQVFFFFFLGVSPVGVPDMSPLCVLKLPAEASAKSDFLFWLIGAKPRCLQDFL